LLLLWRLVSDDEERWHEEPRHIIGQTRMLLLVISCEMKETVPPKQMARPLIRLQTKHECCCCGDSCNMKDKKSGIVIRFSFFSGRDANLRSRRPQ
jgi:hypothetical protein